MTRRVRGAGGLGSRGHAAHTGWVAGPGAAQKWLGRLAATVREAAHRPVDEPPAEPTGMTVADLVSARGLPAAGSRPASANPTPGAPDEPTMPGVAPEPAVPELDGQTERRGRDEKAASSAADPLETAPPPGVPDEPEPERAGASAPAGMPAAVEAPAPVEPLAAVEAPAEATEPPTEPPTEAQAEVPAKPTAHPRTAPVTSPSPSVVSDGLEPAEVVDASPDPAGKPPADAVVEPAPAEAGPVPSADLVEPPWVRVAPAPTPAPEVGGVPAGPRPSAQARRLAHIPGPDPSPIRQAGRADTDGPAPGATGQDNRRAPLVHPPGAHPPVSLRKGPAQPAGRPPFAGPLRPPPGRPPDRFSVAPRPTVVDDLSIIGLTRRSNSRWGSRAFTLCFVFIYAVIVIQLLSVLFGPAR